MESKLTDPWRRVVIRKVHKTIQEVLDQFGQLETMDNNGENGIIDHWGTWYKHSTIDDDKKALFAEQT